MDGYYDLPELEEGELDRPVVTMNKNEAEKIISNLEKHGNKVSLAEKERLRNKYIYYYDYDDFMKSGFKNYVDYLKNKGKK